MRIDALNIVGLVSALISLIGMAFTFRTATAANRTADRKVDIEAFDRQAAIYDKLVERLQIQVDRASDQIVKLTERVASEQDVSNSLRAQVRTLQTQLDDMQATIADLRAQLVARSR